MNNKNHVEFRVTGRFALFTDPVTRLGGEKSTYNIPTYQALIGVLQSIYWKPSIIWFVDSVRVMKKIRTQPKAVKPIKFSGGNELAIYTYLYDVEYQVKAHFIFNENRPQLSEDFNSNKHLSIANRSIKRGGRRDIYLGTRECQALVEACSFGDGVGFYDDKPTKEFGLMFHGYDYPDETGLNEINARFWRPVMKNGVIEFIHPKDCKYRSFLREAKPVEFSVDNNFKISNEVEL